MLLYDEKSSLLLFIINYLQIVPGIPDGPGGVIVCCEGKIVYKTL